MQSFLLVPVVVRGEKYFNAVYTPQQLVPQLHVQRSGDVMCAQALVSPWYEGHWDYNRMLVNLAKVC